MRLTVMTLDRPFTLMRDNDKFQVLLIAFTSLVTRILYLYSPSGQIGGADEAVFGMMAQKIEALQEFPIYCWQAHYAGAPVSYIAAIIFHFFDSGFVQLRLAMLPAAVLTPSLFYIIYRKFAAPSEALAGSLFLVFCPFLVLHHTMAAYGGYGETYLGIALIILLSWKVRENRSGAYAMAWPFLLGFVCGFFFYVLFLILPAVLAFAFPTILFLKRNKIRTVLPFLLGGMIGIFPMIVYNIMKNAGTLTRAIGRSLSIGREEIHAPMMELFKEILVAKLLYLKTWVISIPHFLGQYILPDLFGKWILVIAGSILGVVLLCFTVLAFTKKLSLKDNIYDLQQFSLFIVFLILFQWVANLDRPRHLLPLFLILPVVFLSIAKLCDLRKKAIMVFFLTICGLQVVGWVMKMQNCPFDPKPVVAVMKSKGIREFYGSYWTTYPIMFLSKGQIIGSPYLLPRNEILSDRRPDYTQQLRRSLSPAFVFSANEENLKNRFKEFLVEHQISVRSAEAQGATVFFDTSKAVHAVVKSPWETNFVLKENVSNQKF